MVQFTVSPPDKMMFQTVSGSFAAAGGTISPDGRKLAFTAIDESGKTTLWVRMLESLEARPLPGTEAASHPFWSPDSRSIAFFAPRN